MAASLHSILLTPPPPVTGAPTHARVRNFIARVEQQDYAGAIMHFYHADATAQENMGEIRNGRDAILAHEMETLLRYGNMPVRKVERYAINGNKVFINWIFEVTLPSGQKIAFDEVAMQEWDGDRIRRERFYYDPGQLCR